MSREDWVVLLVCVPPLLLFAAVLLAWFGFV